MPPPLTEATAATELDSEEEQGGSFAVPPIAEASVATAARSGDDIWGEFVPVSRMVLYGIGAMIIGVGIVSFLLGWSMGSGIGAARQVGVIEKSHRIRGRLTYPASGGRTEADTQSVVIALPVAMKPDEKFEIAPLKPEVADPRSRHPTVRGIRSLGGDFAVTDRYGEYELEVPRAGPYFVLMLSGHQARSAQRPATTTEIVQLGGYFRQADELIERNDFSWEKIVVRADKQLDRHFVGE